MVNKSTSRCKNFDLENSLKYLVCSAFAANFDINAFFYLTLWKSQYRIRKKGAS